MSNQASTLSERNQAFFDAFESMSKEPWILDLGKQIIAEILSRLDWMGIPTSSDEDGSTDRDQKTSPFRLLDYACGEGVISRGIFKHIDEAWGIDLTAGMVKMFNQRAAAFEIPDGKKMFAVQGDLLASSSAEDGSSSSSHGTSFAGKEWFDFDLAIMSMALHHVHSPEDAVKKLVERVKEGRSVLFIDWISDTTIRPEPCEHGKAAHELPGAHTTTREGFTKDEMEKILIDAGCEDVGFAEAKELSYLDFGEQRIWRRLFLAKGKKAKQGIIKDFVAKGENYKAPMYLSLLKHKFTPLHPEYIFNDESENLVTYALGAGMPLPPALVELAVPRRATVA